MSGIHRIQRSLDDEKERSSNRSSVIREPGKDYWLKDGDQVFVTVAGPGTDDDLFLDDYWVYNFKNGRYWTDVLAKDDRVDTSKVPPKEDGTPRWPARKFAFWGFIHEVIHTTKTNAEMETIEGPGGRKMFREIVNDYRILNFKFGRNQDNWNQLHDILEDWDSLNQGVIKLKRTGASLDTSYKITRTDRKDVIPEDREKEKSSLMPISDYVFARYGAELTIYAAEPKYTVQSNEGLFS